MTSKVNIVRHGVFDRVARKLVQVGFMVLFIFPLGIIIYKRLTFRPTPTFTSWLLPWDPLLSLGNALQSHWTILVIGAPLLLLALSFLFGRSFCGWVCPVGTILDLTSLLAVWRKRRKSTSRGVIFPPGRNSSLRYYLLVMILVGGIISIKYLGILDPLVIFQRATTSITIDIFALQQPAVQVSLSVFSLVFIGMLILELWQPRFWCRNLCPLGALIGLVSRFSLLNRRVSSICNYCGQCRRVCVMNAIGREPHDTTYADCDFCLECKAECPREGIGFGFGDLAGKCWATFPRSNDTVAPVGQNRELETSRPGSYQKAKMGNPVTRRKFVTGMITGVIGLGLAPLSRVATRTQVIRPPGALPEDEFLRTCVLCQECVRVCPTGGLRPAFLESGLEGIGTPQLLPRQGGCALNPSCPDLCANVCPVGAIKPIKPGQLKLGLAEVDHDLCLAWDQGAHCLVCVEACVVRAAQVYQGRVIVDANKCTGCGRCECGCPVVGSAIHVVPKESKA